MAPVSRSVGFVTAWIVSSPRRSTSLVEISLPPVATIAPGSSGSRR
jgi:hypothetical protein